MRNTTGNSRPLAVCSVINVTTPVSSSGIWSASATRETRSRNACRLPGSASPSLSKSAVKSRARSFAISDSTSDSPLVSAPLSASAAAPEPSFTSALISTDDIIRASAENSRATLTSSLRLSRRVASCGSLERSSSDLYPLRSIIALTKSPISASSPDAISAARASIISTNAAIAFRLRAATAGTLPSATARSAVPNEHRSSSA